MRRARLVLIATAAAAGALLLSLLGSEDSRDADRHQADRRTWQTARDRVASLNAATFELTVRSTRCDPSNLDTCDMVEFAKRETGSLTLEPATLASEWLIERPGRLAGQKETGSARIRLLANGAAYHQDDLFGPTGCWQSGMGTLLDLMEDQARASLDILRSATVASDPALGSSQTELAAVASALPVLRVLGVEESRDEQDGIDDQMRLDLAARPVPLTVLVDRNGAPAGFRIDGASVARALANGDPLTTSTFYLATAQSTDVDFALTALDTVPEVVAPPPDQVVRVGGAGIDDCAAND